MGRRSQKRCVYCGTVGRCTRDHAVPRGLWDGGLPLFTIRVPACRPCNERYAKDEDYFRTVLAAMAGEGKHPEVERLLAGKVMRGLEHRPRLRAEVTRGFGLRERGTPSGLFAGWGRSFQLDVPRLSRVVEKTVRALFFHKSRRPLAEGYAVRVFPGNGFWEDAGFQKVLADMDGWAGLGDDVFGCRCVRDGLDHDVTAWLFAYYKTLAVFAWTEKEAGAGPVGVPESSTRGRVGLPPTGPLLLGPAVPDLTPTGWAYLRSRQRAS